LAGITVWAEGPNVFNWTVQASQDNGLTDDEKAYQCLGVWTKLFDNDPMAKRWASDWNTDNTEFYWYEKEDFWAVFDDAIADAIVAYNKDTRSADVFLIISEPRGLDSALQEIRSYYGTYKGCLEAPNSFL